MAKGRLTASVGRWPFWAITAIALVLYASALYVSREEVPPGLNNDAAEEALRGVYLLESGRFEAINARAVDPSSGPFGVSMETLFLYILGFSAQIMGTTTLAIHVPTWIVALTVVALLCLLARRIDAGLPLWLVPLLTVSSVWMFHYARSGLRANTAPLFLIAFVLLLDRVERSESPFGAGLGAGAILGMSVYAYTSCRVIPLAFLIYVLLRLWRNGERRKDLLRRYALILVATLMTSIPNLVILLRQPEVFLFRGLYVVPEGALAKALNLLQTLALPIHYPDYQQVLGPTHKFDGVSIGLTAAGFSPVHPVVGIAFLVGLVHAWRRRAEPMVSFLLIVWLTGTIVLGISGPSLTRMLVLLPVYLVVAALGFGAVLHFRRAPVVIGTGLLLLTALQTRAYYVTLPQNAVTRLQYRPESTAIGLRARALAATGARVACVVGRNSTVVKYLTHDFRERVRVVEFWLRPVDMNEIPLLQFQPQIVLLERQPEFDSLRAIFLTMGAPEPHAAFDEFKVDPLWILQNVPHMGG